MQILDNLEEQSVKSLSYVPLYGIFSSFCSTKNDFRSRRLLEIETRIRFNLYQSFQTHFDHLEKLCNHLAKEFTAAGKSIILINSGLFFRHSTDYGIASLITLLFVVHGGPFIAMENKMIESDWNSKGLRNFLDALNKTCAGYHELPGEELSTYFRERAKKQIIECLGMKPTASGGVNNQSQNLVNDYRKLLNKTQEFNANSMEKKDVNQVVREWLLVTMDEFLE